MDLKKPMADEMMKICFCNKCGFFGETEPPHYIHDNCDYSAVPTEFTYATTEELSRHLGKLPEEAKAIHARTERLG